MRSPEGALAAAQTPLARYLAAGGGAALALAAWLLLPWSLGRRAPPLRAILVDGSASVTRLRPGWEAWMRAALESEVAEARERGEDVVAVLYAQDVVTLAGPSPVARAARELDRKSPVVGAEGAVASELAAALAVLEARIGGRELARLRIYSDRGVTGADPEALLARTEAHGAPREWVEPPPCELPDLAITRLDLPSEAEAEAPLTARVSLVHRGPEARDPVACELQVELDGETGPTAWTVRTEIDANTAQPSPILLALGPAPRGLLRVRVRARLADQPGGGDAIPENDRAGGSVDVGDDLRIAVAVQPELAADTAPWIDALAATPGLDVRRFEVSELGLALESIDVLATLDVDPRLLPCELLQSFIERGGGWVAFVGVRALAGLDASPCVAELVPLDLAASAGPGRDVVLLLDGSGSMAGPPVEEARRAARALASAVPAQDRVVLRWFTDELEREIDVARDVQALLQPREAGGGTDIPRTLGELAAEREHLQARPALALLVTDGRDQKSGENDLTALRSNLRASAVELAVIAVGSGADVAYLQRLAGPEGRLVAAEDPAGLESILLRESSAHRIRSAGPYEVSFGPDALVEPSSELASPQALGLDSLPALEAYVRTALRPAARAPWLAVAGEPILGLARRGSGAVAGFASLPSRAETGWASRWDASLFEPLLRWLGRSVPTVRPRLRLASATLTLEDAPADWPALVRATAGQDGERREAILAPSDGPLLDPRAARQGRWTWSEPRGAEVTLRPLEPDDAPSLAVLHLPPTTPEEFGWPGRQAAQAPASVSASSSSTGNARGRAETPLGLVFLGLGSALVAGAGLTWRRR